MKPLVPYLFFNGDCLAAMQFYQTCFGGDLQVMTYNDMPVDENNQCSTISNKNAIMHSNLIQGDFSLMASDSPDNSAKIGANIHLSIDCKSLDEIKNLFQKLSVNGQVTQPLADTFWGAHFGMLTDQFGIHWMLNFDYAKK